MFGIPTVGRSLPRRFLSSPFAIAMGCVLMTPSAQAALGYDIVYVRAPRYGDTTQTKWQEVFHPTDAEPGVEAVMLCQNRAVYL